MPHWTIVARPFINPKENLSVELDEEFTAPYFPYSLFPFIDFLVDFLTQSSLCVLYTFKYVAGRDNCIRKFQVLCLSIVSERVHDSTKAYRIFKCICDAIHDWLRKNGVNVIIVQC